MRFYWTKHRCDMAMAAGLKAMHGVKRLPREVPVYSDPDASGVRHVIGTRIVHDVARISRRERHILAMGLP